MLNIVAYLADELKLQQGQVRSALELFAEGGTVPFIARYRKERTGGLDEIALRSLEERHTYLVEVEERKAAILASIEEQGKLTTELQAAIEGCYQKTELEDLYLPFRPKRRTRATMAREKGLEPFADWIRSVNAPEYRGSVDLEEVARAYVSEENGILTTADALQGASDIIAETVAETAEHRAWVRDFLYTSGVFVSTVRDEFPIGTTQYETYREFRIRVRDIAAHTMLALRRGETEGFLTVTLEFEEDPVLAYLASREIRNESPELSGYLKNCLEDAFRRLMKHGLIGEIRFQKKEEADDVSIRTFAGNLRELLLASPAGMRPTIGVDPGFRTGCKIAVLDETGKFIENTTVYPHGSDHARNDARQIILGLVRQYRIELIAVGNGTAGRETHSFIAEWLGELEQKPVLVMVNESGASVYSASEVAIEEFPELDLTVRGAISIGRRLQDPLAELVKIDPKAIGVGQYQHDVDQNLLKRKLEETVESCVNYVGVDVNTASKELLRFVAGITPGAAKNIVEYRNRNGAFRNRRQLLDIPRLGPRAFEQAAGFLRIRNAENPLDNTAVHPEAYPVVESIARDLKVPLEHITRVPDQLDRVNLKNYTSETFGEPTLRDILNELKKPGRDPRAEFSFARFREDVTRPEDLKPGMILEGVVTNVADFGAFVDVGVHRDGLVHVSQLASTFVSDPRKVVKVGQIVKVRVVDVDLNLKRIGLSMRLEETPPTRAPGKTHPEKRKAPEARYSVDDLKRKFNSR